MKENNEMSIDENINQYDVCLSDKEIEEEINSLLNVSDEEIQESLRKCEKKVGRKKTATSIQADKIINDFLTNQTEDNWKNLQEFFWYGIKQYASNKLKEYGHEDPDDAYDMTIETFVSAYENIHTYDSNKAKFSTWLWTICRNNCLGFVKKKSRLKIINNDLSEIYDSELVEASCNYKQNTSDFEHGVFNGAEFIQTDFSEVTKNLYDVSVAEMSGIPGIGGQILHMKLIDGKKIREIVKELSMNESTVKNYLYRGKENLKRILTINHKDLVETYKDMYDAIDSA